MSDVHAAIAAVQLGKLPAIVVDRRRAVDRYRANLDGVAGLTLPVEPSWAESNWQSLIVMVDAGRDRDALIAGLAERDIAAQGGIACAHLEAPYRHCEHRGLEHSEAASRRGLTLPLYYGIDDRDVDRVCDELRRLLA
jgi:dTDP-4-amino-4,6-dideoxygalactose transaminase